MAAWKTCKLGEVADVATGNSNREDAVENGKYPLYDRSPEVKRSNRYLFDFPEGAVIVPGEGQAFVPRFARGKFDLHQRAYEVSPKRVEGKPPEADARYLYYFLMDNRDYFARVATGSTVKSLRQWMFHEMPLSLPSLSEQECIAGVLGAYDDLIAVNARRMALLEEAAHRLYRERFVTHADPSWPSRPLGEVAEVDPFIPVPKHKEEEPLFVSMGALDERSMCVDIFHAERRKAIGGSRFQNGDSLLARISPCLENGKAGFVMGLRPDEVAVGSTEFIVFRGKVWSGHMLYCLLRTPTFRGHAANSLRGADGRQRAQTPFLAAYRVPEPPPEAVAAFDAQVGPYFEAVGVLARENALLREARDGLLPRLLREEA